MKNLAQKKEFARGVQYPSYALGTAPTAVCKALQIRNTSWCFRREEIT